jgi:hypothetical protein
MTHFSQRSQTGIRGGRPIQKAWQAERLPYNIFHAEDKCDSVPPDESL